MLKLAVSNIAWDEGSVDAIERLAEAGVNGVEVAPGKIADWDSLDFAAIRDFRRRCSDVGLVIPSFQAVLFGKPELRLLGTEQEFMGMVEHLRFVAALAAEAGANILVFGAPRNRARNGRDYDEAMALAEDRLGVLAEAVWQHGVAIGLEAVPSVYGCDFIESYREALRLVEAVDSPGLRFHLDGGCTVLNGDDVASAVREGGGRIAHVHISQPDLAGFEQPHPYHEKFSAALGEIRYGGWCCIEMRQQEDFGLVLSAVGFVREMYGKALGGYGEEDQ